MTAPIPQPAAAPPEPPPASPVVVDPVAQPEARIPFADLIEAQRAGTLTGRIAPRLYDDFEAGMVAALTPSPTGTPDGGAVSGDAPGDVVLTPSPGAPEPAPAPVVPLPEYVATIDGRQLTAEDLRTMMKVADQAEHLSPMLEALASGDYVMAPKNYQQPARAEPPAPVIADPIDSMIEEYASADPQAAQIMRVMHQRHAAESARMQAENASLRSVSEQSQQVQQSNGLNDGVALFKQSSGLDDATIDALATRAGQTGYLPMMMQRRYELAQQSGQAVDHAQIAREAAVELMTFARAQYLPPTPTQFIAQPAPIAPVAAPPSIPATNPNPIPVSEADIEARVQARVQEEVQRRTLRGVHSALAGGSSGTPSLAPTPPDLSSMTPAQRKAHHEQALVNGIVAIKSNGGFEGY